MITLLEDKSSKRTGRSNRVNSPQVPTHDPMSVNNRVTTASGSRSPEEITNEVSYVWFSTEMCWFKVICSKTGFIFLFQPSREMNLMFGF